MSSESTLGCFCQHVSSEHLRCYTLKYEFEKTADCMSGVLVYKWRWKVESLSWFGHQGVRGRPVGFENQWGIQDRRVETRIYFIQNTDMHQV